jgi:hypothetical protein
LKNSEIFESYRAERQRVVCSKGGGTGKEGGVRGFLRAYIRALRKEWKGMVYIKGVCIRIRTVAFKVTVVSHAT